MGDGGAWRRAWRRVLGAGPFPWIAAALLILSSTVAVTIAPRPSATPLEPTSYGSVAARLAGNQSLVADGDLDGLPDALENYAYGSDPGRWNSSGTPIPDGWLAEWGYDPLDPTAASKPSASPPPDALPPAYKGVWPARFSPSLLTVYSFGRPGNWSEAEQGPFRNNIDPREWDANGDALPDGWLLSYGVDPRTSDLGGQRLAGPGGLTVLDAFLHGTDPSALDSDRDGLDDAAEIAGSANWGGRAIRFPPTDPAAFSTAGSKACDGYLAGHGLDPTDPAAARGDPDHDGATTEEEYLWSAGRKGADPCRGPGGLDPTDPTSGASTIPDGWFVRYGLDPLDPAAGSRVTGEAPAIPESPGHPAVAAFTLHVQDEYNVGRPPDWDEPKDGPWWGGSDPTKADTDGDGLPDAEELQGWTVNATLVPGSSEGRPEAVTSDPVRADADLDGLADGAERGNGTDPRRRDTDFDGIADGPEIALDTLLAGDDPAANRTRLDPARADSVGDLLRDGERLAFLENRSASIGNGDGYPFPGPPSHARTYDDVAHAQAGGQELATPSPPEALQDFFGPAGDVDGDGQPNLLDGDMDDDRLSNGVEIKPGLYEDTPFGTGPFAAGRSATDPQGQDTDGDLLLDGWEVQFGVPDAKLGLMMPDPAKWKTDPASAAESDAAEDRDQGAGDGVDVPDDSSGALRTLHFSYTNLLEQKYGTDPNQLSSDHDGLLDGWKVYWGITYSGRRDLTLPETPQPGRNQSAAVVSTLEADRFTSRPEERLPTETPLGPAVTVTLPSGATRSVQRVHVRLPWTFRAIQDNQTNPYLSDTDHDTMPDAWEAWRSRHPRPDTAAQCVTTTPLKPTAPDGALDPDRDGVKTAQEYLALGDPLCADSDLGGLPDGKEVGVLHLDDPSDDNSALAGGDHDRDGVKDLDEIGKTDAFNPDTDGDGLLDGKDLTLPAGNDTAALFRSLGVAFHKSGSDYTFLGESKPTGQPRTASPSRADNLLPGVPDGWVLAHGGTTPPADWAQCYAYGRPLWWTLASHGPWWGGGDPLSESCSSLANDPDRDRDGLADSPPSEDPIPVANHDNAFAAGSPFAADVSGPTPANATAIRQRAQGAIVPLQEKAYRVARVDGAQPPVVQRATTLALDDVPADAIRGGQVNVTGHLTDQATGAPLAGATVVARISGEDYGAAFTASDGSFTLPVDLRTAHAVDVPAGSILRGQTSGTASWTAGADKLEARGYSLVIHSYATPQAPASPSHAGAEAVRSIAVRQQAKLAIEAPASARPGDPLAVRIRETDLLGGRLDAPVRVTFAGRIEERDAPGGIVELVLTAPAAGDAEIVVHTLPRDGVLPGQASATVSVRELATLQLDAVQAEVDGGQSLPVSGRVSTPGNVAVREPVTVRLTAGEATLAEAEAALDGQGRFNTLLPIADGASAGPAVLAVTLPAGPGHTEASSSAVTQVRAKTFLLDAAAPALAADGARTIDVRLFDSGGRALGDRELLLRLDGLTFSNRTDATGLARFLLDRPLSAGPHREEVAFAGDATGSPASLARERIVRSPTALALQAVDATAGETLRATAALADATGAPLPARPVRFRLGDGPETTALTDANGTAAAQVPVPAAQALGPSVVTATFAGDGAGAYLASKALAPVDIRLGLRIAMPPALALVGGPVPEARVLDTHDRPVAGLPLVVLVDGVARNATSDANGTIPLLESVPAGPADLDVRVAAPTDARHTGAESALALAVRLPARLAAAQRVLVAGETNLLDVTVRGLDGQPVEGGSVVAGLGNATARALVFGGRATLALAVPDDAGLGDQPLVLRLDGPRHGDPGTASNVSVVQRTVLTAAASPGKPGAPVTLELTALAGGHPLAGVPLSVRVAGQPDGFVVLTDASGKASVPLAYPDAKTDLLVRYAGGASASAALLGGALDPEALAAIAAPRPEGWPIVGATLGIALLVAALVVFAQRRRHPALEALLAAERLISARGPHEADVLACYAVLQDQLVAAGILRGPATTPRALGQALAKAVPLGAAEPMLDRLLTVFERARYSGRAAGPLDRTEAREALRGLRRQLQRQGVAAQAVPA